MEVNRVFDAIVIGAGAAGLFCAAQAGQQITYCFLDDDPVAVAARMLPVLAELWRTAALQPLLAAPFYTVVPYEWERYLP